MTTTREILNRAADLVEQGWCQGLYEKTINGQKCYCPEGAIEKVAIENPGLPITRAKMVFRKHILNLKPWKDGNATIAGWNDEANRTQSEVVALLREVAASLEN